MKTYYTTVCASSVKGYSYHTVREMVLPDDASPPERKNFFLGRQGQRWRHDHGARMYVSLKCRGSVRARKRLARAGGIEI